MLSTIYLKTKKHKLSSMPSSIIGFFENKIYIYQFPD